MYMTVMTMMIMGDAWDVQLCFWGGPGVFNGPGIVLSVLGFQDIPPFRTLSISLSRVEIDMLFWPTALLRARCEARDIVLQ